MNTLKNDSHYHELFLIGRAVNDEMIMDLPFLKKSCQKWRRFSEGRANCPVAEAGATAPPPPPPPPCSTYVLACAVHQLSHGRYTVNTLCQSVDCHTVSTGRTPARPAGKVSTKVAGFPGGTAPTISIADISSPYQ